MDAMRQKVLPCQFNTPGEMVNSLKLAKSLKEAVFERLRGPHKKPVVPVRLAI